MEGNSQWLQEVIQVGPCLVWPKHRGVSLDPCGMRPLSLGDRENLEALPAGGGGGMPHVVETLSSGHICWQ